MTQKTKGPAAVTAEPLQNIGTLERTDEAQFTPWRVELQSRTRGTRLNTYSRTLPSADAFALLVWVNTP